MARRKGIPSYRLHKARNCAVVTLDGKNHYLGRFDSPESYEQYARLIAEWKIGRTGGDTRRPAAVEIIVNELVLAFWEHAKERYVKDGRPTSEVRSFHTALNPVCYLYGRKPVTNFGPLALVACRQKLIEAGYCRKRINQHVGRIRHVFRWGVSRELVPETTWRALCAVEGLKFGAAPETAPIKPVADKLIDAIKPFVTPQIWAMVNLQLWSGCRPGEACVMRTIDINTQGEIWEYRPHSHKTEHHGKERTVYLGRHAQEVIKPWLKTDLQAYLFSPREARAWYQARRAANRKTPRPRKPRKPQHKPQPKRVPSERYTVNAYGHALCRACEVAFGMPEELRRISKELDGDERKRLSQQAAEWREQHCWTPNQLRHNAATRIRAAYGIEAARIILGHSSAVTSEIYAEADHEKAKEIMGKLG